MSLLDSIRGNEGFRSVVYDDATGLPIQQGTLVRGNPTIGYGTLVSEPGGLTKAEAEFLLRNRVATATAGVKDLNVGLTEGPRFDVLVEMAYQMGVPGLGMFRNTLKAVQEKRWDAAADAMLDSLWARQTPKRAQALAWKMRSGVA